MNGLGMNGLVPSNHRPLEHALAASLAPIRAIDPAPVAAVWDAWRCPAALLPFLAWALSVELWEDSWDEIRKRRAIAESPAYHRRKGTAQAVREAAAYTGRRATMLEWHEFVPERRRGTFVVMVHLQGRVLQNGVLQSEAALPAAERDLLRRLIHSAKPKSRAFVLIEAHVQAATLTVGVGISAFDAIVLGVPPDDLAIAFVPRIHVEVTGSISLGVQ